MGLLLAAMLAAAPAGAAAPGASGFDRPGLVPTAGGKQAAKPKAKEAGQEAGKPKADAGAGKKPKAAAKAAAGKKGAAGKEAKAQKPGPLADFGKAAAPEDVVHVANWVSYTRDNRKKAFVLIDKKMAQLYVFDLQGRLKSRTPILLGKAIGDHTVPGIGNKPMAQIEEDEKTTPAGRFLARLGRNTSGEDVIWIDYDAAVSMHRLRKVRAEEQRAERMSTEDASDNRISYGCVNVPAAFYDRVLKPTVTKHGAVVYVLPETKTAQQQFGSFDVAALAAAAPADGGKAGKQGKAAAPARRAAG